MKLRVVVTLETEVELKIDGEWKLPEEFSKIHAAIAEAALSIQRLPENQSFRVVRAAAFEKAPYRPQYSEN